MSRTLRLAVTLLCITCLAVAPASAGDGSSNGALIGGAANETATKWFVELSSPPAVKGTSKATLKAERDAFKANAAADGVKLTERYSFDSLWNGVSVSVAPSQVATLRSVSGVKAVYPVETLSLPPSESVGNNIDLKNAVGLTGADIAQTELGLDGSGVTIAIMDSGLDYTLPEFGGCFGPGLQGARRVRPRRRHLQRDRPAPPSTRFRSRTRILFPVIPTSPTARKFSAPAPPMPHTARTSRASPPPTGEGTLPTARSSVSLRALSCSPTRSSAATAARTAT